MVVLDRIYVAASILGSESFLELTILFLFGIETVQGLLQSRIEPGFLGGRSEATDFVVLMPHNFSMALVQGDQLLGVFMLRLAEADVDNLEEIAAWRAIWGLAISICFGQGFLLAVLECVVGHQDAADVVPQLRLEHLFFF